jgi:methanogenic corrinoid protein MtbC1
MSARVPGGPARPEQRLEANLFEEYFDRVMALAHQRMEIEWTSHHRDDLQRLRPDLEEIHRELGALLRVVFRYGLFDALHAEAVGYATTLARRNSPHDALALLLDSWIVAIQGLIQPPACNLLAAPLKQLREELPGLVRDLEPPKSTDSHVRELMQRAVAGDLPGATDVMRARLAAGVPAFELVPKLFLATMSEIGDRWERNELTIYQEHLATEIVVRLLAGLPAAVSAPPSLGRKALVSCVPDDHIQLVPLALSVYLELRGWQALSLGQGLPADQIAAAAKALQPDAVFLSLAMVARLAGALDTVERLGRLQPRPAVIVGGRGALLARTWLEATGAEVAATFDEAHRQALERQGSYHA